MTNCIYCTNELTGKYCSNCGQPAKIKRIDGHYVKHEIEHVLHFEKGILLTIKELVIRPGQNVREFIDKDRSKLVKPIIFIIVASLIYTLISHFFHIEQGYVNYESSENSTTTLIFNWIQNHYGYGNIIMGVFIAFWLKLFFKKYEYNFFELLILLCFVMGMGMLIFSVFAILEGLTKINLMKISGVIANYIVSGQLDNFLIKIKRQTTLKQ
ncbi:DUF3667 domain-containing protein [Pedobacter sp. NJ-S-72]